MSDERRDDEIIGRALARAIETIAVNQTPYERSRIATRPARRSVFGLWQFATAVAAIVLALAIGTWLARPADRGPVAASPTAPVGSSSPATPPSPATASAAQDPIWVYFARNGLPPIGTFVRGSFLGSSPESRIASRITALGNAVIANQVPAGTTSALTHDKSGGIAVRVRGDLATVEFDPANSWGVSGSAQSLALLQQLVYTITEEPGIHRALITERGRPNTLIDQLVVDKPLSREDVAGYTATAPDRVEDAGSGVVADIVDWRVSVDEVAPGLGRFVIELRPQTATQNPPTPRFVATLERASQEKSVDDGKWILRVALPDAVWNQAPGEAFHCCPVKPVGKTPIRQVNASPLTSNPPTGGAYRGVGFAVTLDDARPWRVAVLQNPLRLVVDVGGVPSSVSDRIVVYRAEAFRATPVCSTTCDVHLVGAARVFEANVVWRVIDSGGKVIAKGFFMTILGTSQVWGTFDNHIQLPTTFTGNATLELYEASPRDGSEQGLVQIPLTIR